MVCAGGLTLKKLTKSQLIYSISCFNLEGLKLRLGGLRPPNAPRGNGTGITSSDMSSYTRNWWSAVSPLVGVVMGVINGTAKIELSSGKVAT